MRDQEINIQALLILGLDIYTNLVEFYEDTNNTFA